MVEVLKDVFVGRRMDTGQCHQEGGRAAQNRRKRIEGCVFEDGGV